MREVSNRSQSSTADAVKQAEQARDAARAKEMDEERRKTLSVQVDPQKQLQTAPTQQHKPEVAAVAAHKEASRLEDSARKFAAQAIAAAPPPQASTAPSATKVEANQEVVRVAAFSRQRDAHIKG